MEKKVSVVLGVALIALGLSVSFGPLAQALVATEFRSTENPTHLIELFSSEGCSSCPPADSWLASLRESGQLWKTFVPIEFHVDYWNRLGWIDRLSKSAFTERQQRYASEWASSSVYTPGFVLDGSEWRPTGSFNQLEAKEPKKVGILSAKRTGRLTFEVSFDSSQGLSHLRVFGALLGNGLESKVHSGENSGSILKHEFAVLGLTQTAMKGRETHFTATIEIPSPLQESIAKSFSAAFWVTKPESQTPLQAVGGDIQL